ncbi:phenylacetic acid degradation bifunctional protein PaaZ [Ascidiaceihabitans sp.]|nr:phenylacetic acid degradation bifunctional protein PaaZ [Ascidiaceihabitans sp.]
MLNVHSFAAGQWIAPSTDARPIESALTGEVIGQAGNSALDVQGMLEYGREIGSPALRAMTFHDRAKMLKALALHLREHREELYQLSFNTGGTQADHLVDVDGGIGTVLVYASKGRRDLPDGQIYLDGPPEQLSRNGTFMGRHICTSLQGVAVHINAFNFPVWGMLEKLAPTLLAGMPAIIKPATATCYVTEACVRIILDSGLLPKGALQLVSGGIRDMLDYLDLQDVVTFTGSANTALKLRGNENILRNSIRFTAEQDSLNASVLGPDAQVGTPEFDLFVKEVQREMTTKSGQKCTAIRRILVPQGTSNAIIETLDKLLANITLGDPREEGTKMGALVSNEQKNDVLKKIAQIGSEAKRVIGDPENHAMSKSKGAYLPPIVFHCDDPDSAQHIHDTEAFGPVSTIMEYRDLGHATELLNKGKGSLVASFITHDGDVAREIAMASGAFHGRLYFNNRDSMAEATGHGTPLPHMVHGGPGRAGGGEELGGTRAVMHYMQRTAIQGSPDILTAIGGQWIPKATIETDKSHPFTRTFHDVELGDTLFSGSREITLEDIETFAHFTGDTFYAHMDEEAAKANPFFPGRVAHGYLLISFAAGLFVQPDPGPVLANTGLDNLRFMKPVRPGDSIKVQLTVKAKTPRNDEYGEVRWHVTLTNQDDEAVAEYELLTMNAY